MPPLLLGTPSIATVMILDDDHGGVFSFPEAEVSVPESSGVFLLQVSRNSGARGKVIIPYRVIEDTAKNGRDFIVSDGHLTFENNETR